jgi:NAD(P)-dependent dehydrogenase (short-subunit alcohol dehydrogenase family)
MTTTKVALVTGASQGLGQATARRLAAAGWRVFGTTRHTHPADDGPVGMLTLDVRHPASVAACVDSVRARAGRLDALVNNAGYPLTGSIEEVSVEEAQAQFETNFFGAVRMMQAVLPLMRVQGGGHVVNVSSAAAFVPLPYYGVYGASKAALERLSLSLREEMRPFGVHVCIVAPSSHRTSVQHLSPAQACGAHTAAHERAVATMCGTVQDGDDPENVARTVLRAVSSRAAKARYLVGGDARAFGFLQRVAPQRLIEVMVRAKIRRGARAALPARSARGAEDQPEPAGDGGEHEQRQAQAGVPEVQRRA